MADEADLAGDQIAKDEEARMAAHRAKMANRPKVSAKICEDCGEMIPEQRRKLAKGCTRCTSCQRDNDQRR